MTVIYIFAIRTNQRIVLLVVPPDIKQEWIHLHTKWLNAFHRSIGFRKDIFTRRFRATYRLY